MRDYLLGTAIGVATGVCGLLVTAWAISGYQPDLEKYRYGEFYSAVFDTGTGGAIICDGKAFSVEARPTTGQPMLYWRCKEPASNLFVLDSDTTGSVLLHNHFSTSDLK